MRYLYLVLLLIITTVTPLFGQSSPTSADRIVALVNDQIILKSDIDQSIADYIRQASFNQQEIPFTKDLWYTFLEAEIDNKVLLEKAKIDSVIITDDQVNQQMDARVSQLIQQAGSEEALEQSFGKSIIQLKADFRETFREQITAQRVRQLKIGEIQITRPEVKEFFESIPKDSLPTIPEQVALSHIVKLPQPKNNAKEASYEFAESLRDSILNQNIPLEELARRHGMDGSAARGGQLPMMGLNELVSEYSAAAAALQPGQISEVVETEFGFHIIRLDERVGDKIKTSHILIRVDAEQLDDASAIAELNSIRDSLLNNPDLTFSGMAIRNSEDPSTSKSGGKIIDSQTGERLIPLNRLDPALYRIVLLMDEIGAVSEPKPFNPNNANAGKAYRIVRLDKQIPEHIASFETDYQRLKSISLQQKQNRELQIWMQELRDDIYIEYRIPKMDTGVAQ
ncbi:MAG: peptidylprolyl isomerase [Balneola sp.]